MSISRQSRVDESASGRAWASDIVPTLRTYLGGRRALWLLGGAALVAGAALNWGWLVAIGVAPLLLAALPCVAMCALGLCMTRMGGRSCSQETKTDQSPTVATLPPPANESAARSPRLEEVVDARPESQEKRA